MEARLSLFLLSLIVASMLQGSSAQNRHVVGDALGWLVPPGGDAAYRTWAASKTFTVGDVLEFNFAVNQHDVAEVSKESFDSCNGTNPISISTTSPTNITLTSPGEHHFICTFSAHCPLGQKLAINVSAAPASQPTSPPSVAAPETAPSPAATTSPPTPARAGMTYTVGDSMGWTVPPGGPIAYQTWARGKSFMAGDTLVFNFARGSHDVVQVTRAEFDSCSISTTTTQPTTTGPARLSLSSAGEHYYICTFSQHCSLGQKLAINVTAGTSIATPPSSSATPPISSGGPTTTTSPQPPSNSATSFAAAALPFTFLAVALAFLYN